MGLFSKLFNKKNSTEQTESDDIQSNVEEFISLIRIYYQASIVTQVGITNLNMVPEFAMYKRMMRIVSSDGKLGTAEKSHVRKKIIADYVIAESFFKEIDASIRKNCKSMRDVQGYFFLFGNFTNYLMTYLSAEIQWKLQGGMMFKALLRPAVISSVNKLMTKNDWKEVSTTKTVRELRKSKETLGYSDNWMTEFLYQIILLSKKDSKESKKRR